MRIVIDTNLLLSAFLWGGTPQRLIDAVRSNAAELVISQALLDEFATVIARPKFAAILAAPHACQPLSWRIYARWRSW